MTTPPDAGPADSGPSEPGPADSESADPGPAESQNDQGTSSQQSSPHNPDQGTTGPGSTDQGASEAGYITDDQLPEELRPEEDPLSGDTAAADEQPQGAPRPGEEGLSDTGREHAGQVSEPTTEMAPGDEPGVTEPTG